MTSDRPLDGGDETSARALTEVLATLADAEQSTVLAREGLACDAFAAFVAQANVDPYDALALLR